MVVLFDVTPIQQTLDSLLEYSYPAIDITPIILTPNHPPRNAQKEALSDMLQDVTETHAAVLLVQESLTRLETSVRLREAALKAALAPVSGLPTEVLRDIFIRVFDIEKFLNTSGVHKSHIHLSAVCSRWRAIALSIHYFWKHIHVRNRTPELFEHFARRSGSLPLNVVLNHLTRGPLVISESAASRINTLELCRFQHEDIMTTLENVASSLRLQRLSLTSTHGLEDYMENQSVEGPLFTLNRGLTSAKNLYLTNSTLSNPLKLRMKRLRNLHIRCVDNSDVSDILHALSNSSVKSIVLDNIAAEDDMPGIVAVTEAFGLEKKITSLDVMYCSGKVLSWICAEWRMKALTSFTLTQPNVFQDETAEYEALLYGFFAGAPNISHLTVDLDAELYYPLTRLLTDATLLPNLTHLNVGFEDGLSEGDEERWGEMKSILHIVEARRRRSKTRNLSTVSVPKWFMKNLVDDVQTLRGILDKFELWDDGKDESDDDSNSENDETTPQ